MLFIKLGGDMTVAIETVLTIVVSIIVAAAGLLYGITARNAALRVRGSLDVLSKQIQNTEMMCGEFKIFQGESRLDRSDLHDGVADLKGDIGVLMGKMEGVAAQLDAVYRKIFNGYAK